MVFRRFSFRLLHLYCTYGRIRKFTEAQHEEQQMPRKNTRQRGPKGSPWYRAFNDTWYLPKINGKARPILDASGLPVKGKENRERAFDVWHQMVIREQAPTRGLDNPLKVIFEEFLDYTQ